jgi:hypothetical protein
VSNLRLPRALLVAGSALLLAGAVTTVQVSASRSSGPPASTGQIPSAAVAGRPKSPPTARTTKGSVASVAIPSVLTVPRLHIRAPLIPMDVRAGGELGIPDDPRDVGWWRGGAWPGSSRGTVVLAGHVDTARDGPGALFHVAELEPGDRIDVLTDQGTRPYAVVARRSFHKADLPNDVFAATGRPRLVIITCGGTFDSRSRHYTDNVVVYALPGHS